MTQYLNNDCNFIEDEKIISKLFLLDLAFLEIIQISLNRVAGVKVLGSGKI